MKIVYNAPHFPSNYTLAILFYGGRKPPNTESVCVWQLWAKAYFLLRILEALLLDAVAANSWYKLLYSPPQHRFSASSIEAKSRQLPSTQTYA